MADRESHTLAARGLEERGVNIVHSFPYTRFAWAGGTFFPVVSFWFWREIGFGFTYLRTLLNNVFWN